MTIPDWDNYICKHCARYYGWLPASKEFAARIRKKHVKYFTLSDTQAIDIFMFEMEGVLVRDGNNMLPEVVSVKRILVKFQLYLMLLDLHYVKLSYMGVYRNY